MTRRLFYAIEFPEDIRQKLFQAGRELAVFADRGRWTRPENIHLTLQFLGECPDDWLPDLTGIARQAAAASHSFPMSFAGAGTFGRTGDILWIGIRPQPALSELAAHLTDLLRLKALPYEKRHFSPHITIGRQVRLDSRRLAAWSMPPLTCRIDSISLMESTRIDEKLVYQAICREKLRTDTRSMCDNRF